MKIVNNSNSDLGLLFGQQEVFKVKIILLKNQNATRCAVTMQPSSYNVGFDCTNREPPSNTGVQDTRGIRRSA